MISGQEDRIGAFVEACHRVGRLGLVRFSSGNMSCRLDAERMAVTGKGTWLGELKRDHVAICRIADGRAVAELGSGLPSVEAGFHAGILRARPDMNVVLHCQSPCATAIACGDPAIWSFDIIPEVPFYIGTPGVVDYENPGSPELAVAVVGSAAKHDLILLRNHGQVVLGRSFDDAIQRAGFFELACEILLLDRDVRPMPQAGIDALRERAKREGV